MKGYLLRDKEVEEEAKKAKKAKNQGQWTRGRWESPASGGLKWIRQKFIPGQTLKEEFYGLEHRRFQYLGLRIAGLVFCVWPGP